MKLLEPLAALTLVVSIGAVAAPASAAAPAKPPKTICTAVEATAIGVVDRSTGDTVADVAAGPGLPVGTITGPLTITGTPPNLTISGPLVFTAKLGRYSLGTLRIAATGTLDATTGEFTAAGPITGSTGILRGVTGDLTFTGVVDLTANTFTETVTGTLCAPRR